ncbi:MAG: prepilin peptidase [Rhodospirillales bacterium]|nr:prepilin peptidase [Rhodospirillales bacterium]
MTALLPTLLGISGLLLVAAAAVHDVMARTVPTSLCLAIASVGLAARIGSGDAPSALAAACLVFLGTAWCWRRGWLGGGDVKLLAACALLVPPHAVPGLVAGTAIAGAGLAAVYLAARRWVRPSYGSRPLGLLARATRAERWRIARGGPLPYAVAIALGTAAMMMSAPRPAAPAGAAATKAQALPAHPPVPAARADRGPAIAWTGRRADRA